MTAGDRIREYRGQHATHEGHRCRDALTPSAVPSNEIHPDAILCVANVRLKVLQSLLDPLPTTQQCGAGGDTAKSSRRIAWPPAGCRALYARRTPRGKGSY